MIWSPTQVMKWGYSTCFSGYTNYPQAGGTRPARRFREHGHEVKLMAPQFVKPYVKSHKNAMRDAEGMSEAVTRPTMRFVPTKELDQQDIQALHRVRERLIGARTALVNEGHGLLNEYGIVVPKGVSKFRQTVVDKLESEKAKLTPLSQEMFWKLVEEFAALEAQLAYYQEQLDTLAATHPACQRLMTIPGIGPFTATALVAAVSDGEQGDAGGNFKTPVEWPVLFIGHSNPEKPPYACQTATCHVTGCKF
jgi:transposase